MNKNIVFYPLVFILFTGCAKLTRENPGYVIAQSAVVLKKTPVVESEIVESPHYKLARAKIKSVAIAAPTQCESKSVSAITGNAANQGTTVATNCGVEMAELERALLRQGFTVQSWNMMNNRATGKESGNSSDVLAMAKKNGAQVLFQVNSLERVKLYPELDKNLVNYQSLDAHIVNEYFDSDAQGQMYGSASISKTRADTLDSYLRPSTPALLKNAMMPGAMLDLNAIDVETGQAVWFYRGKISNSSSSSIKNSLLWCDNDTKCYTISPAYPKQQKTKIEGIEITDFSIQARPTQSLTDSKYFELLREVTSDFAKKFQFGKSQ